MPPLKRKPRIVGKPFQVVNKDLSIVAEFNSREEAILHCWVVLNQRVVEVATGQIIFP